MGMILWERRAEPWHSAPTAVGCTASAGSYSHYRIHPLPLMIHITHLDHLTPSHSLCLILAQADI